MRISYIHQYYNTRQMAGSTRSFELAARLANRGHEVHIITSNREGEQGAPWTRTEEASGVQVHWCRVPYRNSMSKPERLAAFARFAGAAGRRAAEVGPDLVLATSTPLTVVIPGVQAAMAAKTPFVFEVRDLWPEVPIALGALRAPPVKASARVLADFAYASAARVVALSPDMATGVEARGYPRRQITIIPNSADLDLFPADLAVAESLRASLPWLGVRPLIAYVGTIGRANDVCYLADIASRMKTMNLEVRFLVVGAGGEKIRLEHYAARLGVLNENFFMWDSVPKEQVPGVLATANILTSLCAADPALEGNSANKLFDGLAAAKPVAVNYGGWHAAMLEANEAGFRLSRSPDLAARTLAEWLRKPTELKQYGMAGRRLAEAEFSRDAAADALAGVLDAAAGEPPTSMRRTARLAREMRQQRNGLAPRPRAGWAVSVGPR